MAEVWFQNAPMVTGRGSLSHLARIGAKRVAVVADLRALNAGGALPRMEAALREARSEWKIVHDAQREPRMADIDAARAAVLSFQPDMILAIGGGAAIDVAKALWFFYEQPGAGWDQAFVPFGIAPLGKRARLIAVPTTSGTGSETTCVAVFVDDSHRKRLMMSRELIPSLAILDPDLVDSVPTAVAAASGMDALTHAMEAAVCTIAGPMVGAVAEEASTCTLNGCHGPSSPTRVPTSVAPRAKSSTTQHPGPAWPSTTRAPASRTRWTRSARSSGCPTAWHARLRSPTRLHSSAPSPASAGFPGLWVAAQPAAGPMSSS
jgi:alcohol dehydrogenase class IV